MSLSSSQKDVLVILWEWREDTPHAGARFWGAHDIDQDGRIRDWPEIGLRPLGAARVTVSEGIGLDLLATGDRTDGV